MRIVEFLLNLVGWFQIVIGTTLIGAIIGAAIYYFNNPVGFIIGVILTSIGFISGVVWATWIWRKHGTIDWLSRIRRISYVFL
jgi:uncharacterized membrane protein YqaE (UPF0057 family)